MNRVIIALSLCTVLMFSSCHKSGEGKHEEAKDSQETKEVEGGVLENYVQKPIDKAQEIKDRAEAVEDEMNEEIQEFEDGK